MANLAGLIAGNSTVVTGVAGVAVVGVVGVALAVSGVFAPDSNPSKSPQSSALVTAIEPAPPEIEKTDPQGDPIEPALPRFDVVRIEADGTAMIAGKGIADTKVEILMDGMEIGSAIVDPKGWFLSDLNIEPSDKPRVLTLKMRNAVSGEVLTSDQAVIIAATVAIAEVEAEDTVVVAAVAKDPEKAIAPPAQVAKAQTPKTPAIESKAGGTIERPPETAPMEQAVVQDAATIPAKVARATVLPTQPDTLRDPDPDTSKQNGDVTPVEVVISEKPKETPPTVQTVLLADNNGVRVLQAPQLSDVAPVVMSTVALDTISYSDKGEVQISGRSGAGGFVRVYLDNRPITTSRIAQDGNWKMELPNIVTGIYTLRVDEVDTSGTVTSRVETPFKREEPRVVAAAQQAARPIKTTGPQEMSVRVVTVQAGSTLWEIARNNYGDGTQYIRVFQANKDRIRNADLIYPGQVFNVPSDVVSR